jgi:hypothetical protein
MGIMGISRPDLDKPITAIVSFFLINKRFE